MIHFRAITHCTEYREPVRPEEINELKRINDEMLYTEANDHMTENDYLYMRVLNKRKQEIIDANTLHFDRIVNATKDEFIHIILIFNALTAVYKSMMNLGRMEGITEEEYLTAEMKKLGFEYWED